MLSQFLLEGQGGGNRCLIETIILYLHIWCILICWCDWSINGSSCHDYESIDLKVVVSGLWGIRDQRQIGQALWESWAAIAYRRSAAARPSMRRAVSAAGRVVWPGSGQIWGDKWWGESAKARLWWDHSRQRGRGVDRSSTVTTRQRRK